MRDDEGMKEGMGRNDNSNEMRMGEQGGKGGWGPVRMVGTCCFFPSLCFVFCLHPLMLCDLKDKAKKKNSCSLCAATFTVQRCRMHLDAILLHKCWPIRALHHVPIGYIGEKRFFTLLLCKMTDTNCAATKKLELYVVLSLALPSWRCRQK